MRVIETAPAGRGQRVAIVASRFNELVTERLVDGAVKALVKAGVSEEEVTVVWVPGAFELPLAASQAIAGGATSVVAVGAVIRGETDHYEYVAGQAAAGLARVQLDTRVPVGFGVVTVETLEQALDRAGGKHGNAGARAAEAVLSMVDSASRLCRPD